MSGYERKNLTEEKIEELKEEDLDQSSKRKREDDGEAWSLKDRERVEYEGVRCSQYEEESWSSARRLV